MNDSTTERYDTTPDGSDTTELTTLYDASDGGTAEWWPEEIQETDDELAIEEGERFVYYIDAHNGGWVTIKQPHALAIVRDSAERWLVEQDWCIHKTLTLPIITLVSYSTYKQDPIHSLADAIRAEMGRGEKK